MNVFLGCIQTTQRSPSKHRFLHHAGQKHPATTPLSRVLRSPGIRPSPSRCHSCFLGLWQSGGLHLKSKSLSESPTAAPLLEDFGPDVRSSRTGKIQQMILAYDIRCKKFTLWPFSSFLGPFLAPSRAYFLRHPCSLNPFSSFLRSLVPFWTLSRNSCHKSF